MDRHTVFGSVLSIALLMSSLAAAQTAPGGLGPVPKLSEQLVLKPPLMRIDPARVRGYAALRQASVQRNKRVRVIVRLSNSAIAGQQGVLDVAPAAINLPATPLATAQSRLANRMRQLGIPHASAIQGVPFVVMEASAAELDHLIAEGEVASIVEDQMEEPQLAETGQIVRVQQAHTFGASGAGKTIAFIDTGIERGHPWLKGRIVEEACYSTNSETEQTASICPSRASSSTAAGSGEACRMPVLNQQAAGWDFCTHGTFVAGIAAGRTGGFTQGMAPDAGIFSIQVASQRPDADCARQNRPVPCYAVFTSDQVRALQRVRDRRAARNIVVVSLPFASTLAFNETCDDSDPRAPLIVDLAEAGVPTVVTVGNHGENEVVSFPGCISRAITVGSTGDTDAGSSFSNTHGVIDVFAPGENVTSSTIGGALHTRSGTSAAAAHVVGAIAALKSRAPDAAGTVEQLVVALQATGPLIEWRATVGSPSRARLDVEALVRTQRAGPVDLPEGVPMDLDTGVLGGTGTTSDVSLYRQQSNLYVLPRNGATLWFGTGTRRGFHGCKAGRVPRMPGQSDGYVSSPLNLSTVYDGQHVCMKTNAGRFAQIRIIDLISGTSGQSVLKTLYTTWNP